MEKPAINNQTAALQPPVAAAPATPPQTPQSPPAQAMAGQTTNSVQPNKNAAVPKYCQLMASDPRASAGILKALEAQQSKEE
jgi:hypothetical protein